MDFVTELLDFLPDYDQWDIVSDYLPNMGKIIAQRVRDPDVIGQIQKSWANFIKTGQVWAMLIGMFLGYMFSKFTSF